MIAKPAWYAIGSSEVVNRFARCPFLGEFGQILGWFTRSVGAEVIVRLETRLDIPSSYRGYLFVYKLAISFAPSKRCLILRPSAFA